MTAPTTTTAPTAATAAAEPTATNVTPGGNAPGARSASRPLLPAAEVALALVTLATTATLWRLFVDRSFLVPLAVHVGAAHVVVTLCRRKGLGLGPSAVITAVAAAAVITWVHLGSTTALGLPTTETLRQARVLLEEAWLTFGEVRAPAPVLPGFLIAVGVAVWIGAWLADVAAFRLWTPFEALIPSGTVFVFASLFAADQGRARSAALWITACLCFILVHRTARQQSSPAWLGSDPGRGTASLLRVGLAFIGFTVVLGFLAGPLVPTAKAEGVYDLGDLDGDSSRITISPLVEIQRRLLEQADVELFTVQVRNPDVRPYWRLTSLDIFDGSLWRISGSFQGAGGELDGLGDVPPGAIPFSQDVSISNLAAIWLPAAFEPRAIDGRGAEVRWEPETSTLIVSTALPDSDGVSYEVTSELPAFQPSQLTGTGAPPEEVIERGLGLPPDFPERVRQEALNVVAGATTPYEQALRLQEYFRNGSFIYSLEVPASHSNRAMEEFLFETRTGYCEQFAGTYAAMARAIGLPARVAVGFTPGNPDPAVPGLYRIRGENAHAWPEVWISGAGWVPFEPTPGRGSQLMQPYTNVQEQQDTAGPSVDPAAPIDNPGGPGPDPEANPGVTPEGATTTTVPPPVETAAPPAGPNRVLRAIPWVLLTLLGAVLFVALVASAIAIFRHLRRSRRRRLATTPDAVVRAAWQEAIEDVGMLGFAPRRYETPDEVATRMNRAVGAGGDSAGSGATGLATLVARADFAPDGATPDDADRALDLAGDVRTAVRECTTPMARLLASVDPRPPDRRGPREKHEGPRIQVRTT